jgi:hypothetical protein
MIYHLTFFNLHLFFKYHFSLMSPVAYCLKNESCEINEKCTMKIVKSAPSDRIIVKGISL